MKKILAITGIRSEYDILYPVLNELRNREAFEVGVAVCGVGVGVGVIGRVGVGTGVFGGTPGCTHIRTLN